MGPLHSFSFVIFCYFSRQMFKTLTIYAEWITLWIVDHWEHSPRKFRTLEVLFSKLGMLNTSSVTKFRKYDLFTEELELNRILWTLLEVNVSLKQMQMVQDWRKAVTLTAACWRSQQWLESSGKLAQKCGARHYRYIKASNTLYHDSGYISKAYHKYFLYCSFFFCQESNFLHCLKETYRKLTKPFVK